MRKGRVANCRPPLTAKERHTKRAATALRSLLRRSIPQIGALLRLVRRWALLLLLVLSLIPALVYRSWVDAQIGAVVVLATASDTPVLAWLARSLTDRPRVAEVRIAGQDATLARPGDGKRWPAVVFVNGATERGHLHPEVQRLARGLARAGYLVVVPELPGLRRGEITLPTLAVTVAVARSTAARADVARGHVGLIGVSVGASLALCAAEDGRLAGRVSGVVGIAPYADLKAVALLATTGYVQTGGRLVPYNADDFVQLAVARSLAAGLPARRDRKRLVRLLAAIPNERDDPLDDFRPRGLGPQGRALVRLLQNRDSGSFERLWQGLSPALVTAARRLSPVVRLAGLNAPVLLATSPNDKYFPVAESRRLAARSDNVHVTVTSSLSHAIPELSLGGLGDALAFDGFAVRGLRILRR
jgi:pimeloyl-ACP methyl ester carboxylesterase